MQACVVVCHTHSLGNDRLLSQNYTPALPIIDLDSCPSLHHLLIMAPKNKSKKGRKQDDDDYWETAGTSVLDNNVKTDLPDPSNQPMANESRVDTSTIADAEDEDFGGLMVCSRASMRIIC